MNQKEVKELMRDSLNEEGRQSPKPKCPCCGKDMVYQGFIFFDDPCVCGSGKFFKDCCFKAG